MQQVTQTVADSQPLSVSRKGADDTRVAFVVPELTSAPSVGANGRSDEVPTDPDPLPAEITQPEPPQNPSLRGRAR